MSNAAKLTPTQVMDIYAQKVALTAPREWNSCFGTRPLKGHSARLSKLYGVSSKTIHDIWNRRSWTAETGCLWHIETKPALSYAQYIQLDTISYDAIPHDAMMMKPLNSDPFYDDWPYWQNDHFTATENK